LPTERFERFLPLFAALVLMWAPGRVAATSDTAMDSFLLPGVEAADIEFQVGAWCRYLIVDEAMGEIDSTLFYFAVLDRETTPDGDSFWVEVEMQPSRATRAQREVARALVAGTVHDLADGDSLYRYVRELYVKKGSDPVEPADPVDLKRVTLARPTSESDWTRREGVDVRTPGREWICDFKELTVEESREVPTGGVTLLQRTSDRFRVWTSDEVPVFGMVKCVIERSRESRTVPPVPGIPNAGARESRTTAVVVDYGSDARPLMSIP
jgi:hypothetical protein